MAEALDWDDPVKGLRALAAASQRRADEQALRLREELENWQIPLPEILSMFTHDSDHPVHGAIACADSIYHSLDKIASGGSQASQEIRQLEQEKRDLDDHAQAVQIALALRKNSDRAVQAFQTQQWPVVAEAVRTWLEWKDQEDNTSADPRVRAYAGEYTLQQLANTYAKLKDILLEQYDAAVQKGDLQALSQLTPILSIIRLESDGVLLYIQFIKTVVLRASFQEALNQPPPKGYATAPPYIPMARVYNAAVVCLRHHLPMVSHSLYKADGDVAVVQLVHQQVEEAVLPLIAAYQRDRQFAMVSRHASRIYATLEQRYAGRSVVDESDEGDADDGGFSVAIGSLVDTDATMEETALCLQHSESFLRFIQHTCDEVNRARKIRYEQAVRQARLERERHEWEAGKSVEHDEMEEEKEYESIQILPHITQLHQSLAELGGQYAGIERCLLLASMQRAFVSSDADPRYYRQLVIPGVTTPQLQALQTSLIESCLFAARRGTQRALATGHTGTASAMTNFCADCLTGVLLEVMSHRAEESGIAHLKPGDGLLGASAGLFNNASSLIRQGAQVGSAGAPKDEQLRKQKAKEKVARACATLNDLEVAIYHIEQIEALLNESIDRGFPPNTHETEQLRMCVKNLGSVTDSFKLAANRAVESLESVLKHRVRSIVGEAIGADASTAASFMGSSVMGGGKGSDRVTMRMNYNLDEESYNLMQASEGYVSRMCTALDELLEPLRWHLAPRLWDTLLLNIVGVLCKRMEASLRKVQFSALGALAFDSDVRDLLTYTKERLYSPDYGSNVVVARSCPPLSRLINLAKLVSVDDLDDVLDLIGNAKRKGNWDIKLEDAKAFLCARVEFEASKVSEYLRIPDDDA